MEGTQFEISVKYSDLGNGHLILVGVCKTGC